MADRFERFLGDTIGQIAVPGFFLISSYLFYRNFHWSMLWSKWRSRIRSILVPYVLWNMIYYAGYVIGSRMPFVTMVIGKGKIPADFAGLADAAVNYRYLYVFWYLHQLLLLIMLAPVLYLLLRHFRSGLLCLAAVFWSVWAGVDFPWLNEDALFYYGTGAFLALHGRQLEVGWTRKRGFLGLLLVAVGCFNLYLTGKYFLPGTTVLYRLLVPLGLWLAADEKRLSAVRPWMECNFFLYCIHFAFVRLINKTAAIFAPPVMFIPIFLYLLMPGLMVGISYGVSVLAKGYMPRIWKVVNGGR